MYGSNNMIVSNKKEVESIEFENLLFKAKSLLDRNAKKNSEYYLSRGGVKFEYDVFNALQKIAKGSIFQDSFELVSGRSFPDIVAKKLYGIEVKTSSKGDPWKCVGNSVMESSRIETVENIYIFFGKIIAPVEFGYRKYQECLYDIAVTHSPRYMVNFNTAQGDTIFDKICMPYDELRVKENPIQPFIRYYKQKHNGNCDVWWIDSEQTGNATSFVIEYWNQIEFEKQIELKVQMLVLFPDIIRKGRAGDNKYNKAAAWLLKKHNIINPSFRDIFTGGKLSSMIIDGNEYIKVPPFFKKIKGKIKEALEFLESLSTDELLDYWGTEVSPNNRTKQWLELFTEYGGEWLSSSGSNLDIKTYINSEL